VLGEHAVDAPDGPGPRYHITSPQPHPPTWSHVSKSSAEPGKWSASRIAFELSQQGVISRRTVSRHLAALGLNRRRFIDPTGQTNRSPQRIIARRPGHMIHVDVKKVAHIPGGGGWRARGKDSNLARQVARLKKRTERGGYVYLHSAIDGYSRLAYTTDHLPPPASHQQHDLMASCI